jgi:WD40 repeat protein/actin-like ATPase involved in cell morphogenesis
MMYALGVDLGTTYTAAATWRDGQAEIVSLGSRASVIPSVVLPREDGTTLTGEAASRRALTEPQLVAREFKRRVGDTTPILLGGIPYTALALTARLLRSVLDEVSTREGGPPSAICVSHPANWGPYKEDLLREAPQLAGIEVPVSYPTEPEAAATFYAQQQRIPPGAMVAVYDLGGGTFDAAVLRKAQTGFEIIGQPGGIERLGGIDFDAAVFHHVTQALDGKLEELDEDDPTVIAAVARLRQECTAAKEALSSDTDTSIAVLLPNAATEVRLTRAELEAMVRPALYDSIQVLRSVLRSAEVSPDQLHSVLLVGGSSRMPIVAQLVGAELGRPVTVDAHPKHAVALGAAWLASGRAGLIAAPAVPADAPPVPAAARAAAPPPPVDVAATAITPRGVAGVAPPVSPAAPPITPPPVSPAAPPVSAAMASAPTRVLPPPMGPWQGRRRGRLLAVGAAAAAVVLAAGVAGYALLRPESDGGPGPNPPPSVNPDPPFEGTLTGHQQAVWGVAFSRDGSLLASAGLDQTIRLWDTTTGEQNGEPLTGHTNEVSSVSFSPDGTLLASASDDGTIRLWDVTSGEQRGEPLTDHTDEVTTAQFSPDGTLLASASDDGTVRIWDVATGQPRGAAIAGLSPRTVTFSPDGATAAVGSFDGEIYLVDVDAGQVTGAPFTGHQGTVRSVAFSPDGTVLASGGDDGTVRLWDVAGRQPRGEPLTGHTEQVWGVAFGPDGQLLASGGVDRTVRLWDAATGQPRGEPLTGHEGSIRTVAVSPDGRSVAAGGDDRTIRMWTIPAG